MKIDFIRGTTISIMIVFISSSCVPKATPPPVDIIGTTAAQLAEVMLTQTAGAHSPTPLPPTDTPMPMFTDTPAVVTERPQITPPRLIAQTGCWTGPGDSYTLISNIELNQQGRKNVIILGTGSVEGWMVIRNPYFNNPCWVETSKLEIDPNMDMSQFPLMTPGP